ncbi:MAG: GNAT family N-acetyltransferase, partial [Rhodospirillales bacterium]|nr:GNAT family N-acetyltransferase [Rhodospirillales bacterium]
HAVNRGRADFDIHPWQAGDDRPIETFLALHEGTDRAPAFQSAAEIRDFLEGGDGDLIAASMKGEPLAAVLVAYEGDTAYYMASVSVDRGGVPASHWPLYRAILGARDKGKRSFDLGYLHGDEGMDEKLRGIARFKGGFTRDRRRYLWWSVFNHGAAT